MTKNLEQTHKNLADVLGDGLRHPVLSPLRPPREGVFVRFWVSEYAEVPGSFVDHRNAMGFRVEYLPEYVFPHSGHSIGHIPELSGRPVFWMETVRDRSYICNLEAAPTLGVAGFPTQLSGKLSEHIESDLLY